MGRPSFAQAKAQFPHRYTMEHVPQWAREACTGNGRFYAPQYRTDAEWYAATVFPGEPGLHGNSRHCFSSGETWPLGHWLDEPYRRAGR